MVAAAVAVVVAAAALTIEVAELDPVADGTEAREVGVKAGDAGGLVGCVDKDSVVAAVVVVVVADVTKVEEVVVTTGGAGGLAVVVDDNGDVLAAVAVVVVPKALADKPAGLVAGVTKVEEIGGTTTTGGVDNSDVVAAVAVVVVPEVLADEPAGFDPVASGVRAGEIGGTTGGARKDNVVAAVVVVVVAEALAGKAAGVNPVASGVKAGEAGVATSGANELAGVIGKDHIFAAGGSVNNEGLLLNALDNRCEAVGREEALAGGFASKFCVCCAAKASRKLCIRAVPASKVSGVGTVASLLGIGLLNEGLILDPLEGGSAGGKEDVLADGFAGKFCFFGAAVKASIIFCIRSDRSWKESEPFGSLLAFSDVFGFFVLAEVFAGFVLPVSCDPEGCVFGFSLLLGGFVTTGVTSRPEIFVHRLDRTSHIANPKLAIAKSAILPTLAGSQLSLYINKWVTPHHPNLAARFT